MGENMSGKIFPHIPNGSTTQRRNSRSSLLRLYVATKFNDEARAKLVLRWEELEHERIARQEKMSDLEIVCRALMIQKRQIEEKDKLIEVLQPRADYCDEVLDSIDCMTMTQVAVSEPEDFHRHENSRF